MNALREQFRHHSVALISLAIALAGLAYNTWRNELTEANRNVRTAGVELLLTLGQLEQTVFLGHYDRDEVRGNPRAGWAHVLLIVDLASLIPEPLPASAGELLQVWQENWPGLGSEEAAVQRITARIDAVRADTLAVLAALD